MPIGNADEVLYPLCKHPTPTKTPSAVWTPGQTELKYMFVGGPSLVSNTPSKVEYTVTLPESLPGANHAVFAWTWINASGQREYFMNCVDVKIIGTPGSFNGKKMVVANYGPETPTIPEFYGDYNTGINIYINSPNITVTGHGSD
ncbi:hypothetical protein GGI04_005198 [Coemansia thaxteri]|nr:hypothetical protein GGI04_005198 [Coemansia thaxteri]